MQRDLPSMARSLTRIVSYRCSSTESLSSLPTDEMGPASDDSFELARFGSPSKLRSGELDLIERSSFFKED